nr:MAG TPA: hypothetical protein [Caudoviricetes sp.]
MGHGRTTDQKLYHLLSLCIAILPLKTHLLFCLQKYQLPIKCL